MFVDTVFIRIILYTIIGVGLSNEFFFSLLLSRLDPKIADTFIYIYIYRNFDISISGNPDNVSHKC